MSIGPLGTIGSLAGSPLSQSKGSELDKAQQETANQARQTQAEQKAESAAGVGQTEQDEQASERDADGRRLWEEPPGQKKTEEPAETPAAPPPSKDPSGQSGSQLDLSG